VQGARERERCGERAGALDAQRERSLLPDEDVAGEADAVGAEGAVGREVGELVRRAREIDARAAVDADELRARGAT